MIIEEVHNDMRTAIEYGRTDIVKTIIDAYVKNSSNERDTGKEKLLDEPLLDEGTFLCLAAKLNRTDIVRTFLAAGADPCVHNRNNQNALELASSDQTKHTFVEELLRAIANSQLERIHQLVKAGVNINTWDSEATRNTPLHWAACYADSRVVAYLIQQGADMNAVNSWGATPLHEGIDRGDIEVIGELLRGGPNLEIRATRGKHSGKNPLDMLHSRPQLASLLDNNNSHMSRHSEAVPMVNLKRHTRPARSISVDSYHTSNKSEDLITNGLVHEKRQPVEPLSQSLNHASSLELTPKLEQVIESLVRTHITTPVRPLVTNPSLHLLWPQPQNMLELPGSPFVPEQQLHISVIQTATNVHEILNVWEVHRSRLLKLGLDVRVRDVQPSCGRPYSSQVQCVVNPDLFSHQHAYQIHISSDKVQISSDSVTSLHYAVCTFTQLLQLAHAQDSLDLVPVLIQDYPAMKHRGVLLDIAPMSRVPNTGLLV
ncbi:poly [ADP-ribose] polymerase tankyrase-like isoform X1 [Homalodisca vitripennis]|uniref:poly [ADP-ribose] polymerase tankyrase-like isoform X1 n=1 Tax=Homalodisca vitripennis TaxID=197043 RepID=UPI001EEA6176|nr:poly [ADP-ribose] polymerase tankyrase-like isoform X1 [Homalodisca vitripennis]XP_046665375.1 poly [ADP-ribose] polymerase tankyrase-like isoform X1 [Homalodisca vitripennis]